MTDPQSTLLDALPDDLLLEMLGPSWELMTPAQRDNYGRPGARPYDVLLDPIREDTARLWASIDDLMLALEHELSAWERRQKRGDYRLGRP